MYMKWWTADSNLKKPLSKHLSILILSLLILFSSGCALLPDEQAEEELPPITPPKLSEKPVYDVTTETLITKVRGTGKMMSLKEENLFFVEDGLRIQEIYVKSGDEVAEGQVIAELDVTDLQNDLRRKKLQFRQNELDMKMTLRRANEMTAEELEQAKIDFELARNEIVELEEKIAGSKLKAPFSGTIVSVSMNRGDTTTAYESVAVLADLNQLTVAAKFNDKDLEQIALGMDAEVDINTAGVHTGKVERLPVEGSDNDQGRYPPYYPPNQRNQQDSIDNYLLVDLPEIPESVTRGTPLSVSIIVQEKENVVVIPPAALRSYGGRNYVQVIDAEGSRREVDVEVGQRTSTLVEIVKGLEPGQKVVGR